MSPEPRFYKIPDTSRMEYIDPIYSKRDPICTSLERRKNFGTYLSVVKSEKPYEDEKVVFNLK